MADEANRQPESDEPNNPEKGSPTSKDNWGGSTSIDRDQLKHIIGTQGKTKTSWAVRASERADGVYMWLAAIAFVVYFVGIGIAVSNFYPVDRSGWWNFPGDFDVPAKGAYGLFLVPFGFSFAAISNRVRVAHLVATVWFAVNGITLGLLGLWAQSRDARFVDTIDIALPLIVGSGLAFIAVFMALRLGRFGAMFGIFGGLLLPFLVIYAPLLIFAFGPR